MGNEYYFGLEDTDRAHYPNLDPELCPNQDGDPVTWRWALSKIRNIYGEELIFNYSIASKWVGSDICGEMRNYGVDLDIYPFEIRYPNLRYRVVFEASTNRLDFANELETPYSYIFYQRTRLNRIVIQHNPDGDVNFNDVEEVRSYDLVYASSGQTIFPNYTWTEGGNTLTLVEIHEHGEGGAGRCQPPPSPTRTACT